MFFGEPKKYSSMESLWKTPFGTFKYIMGIWVLDLLSVFSVNQLQGHYPIQNKQTNKQKYNKCIVICIV